MFLFRCVSSGFLVACLLVSPAAALETAAGGSAAVAAELEALTASIERLTAILEAQSGSEKEDLLYQKLNLAIAYLNFRSRRIEMLEQDVQQARAAKGQIESTLTVWLQQREELADADSAIASEEVRQRRDEIQMRIDLVRERVARLDDEIVSLENRIYELQGQIDSVEEFVQKNLAL